MLIITDLIQFGLMAWTVYIVITTSMQVSSRLYLRVRNYLYLAMWLTTWS